jgi:hypothetical protein
MSKLQNRMQLLSLITIFFIYRAIVGYFEKNNVEIIIWSLISVVYIISLIILYFIVKRWQKETKNQK